MLRSLFGRRHRPTLEELEEVREKRTRGLRGILGVSGIIFMVLVAFVASMFLLTPLLELYALEQEKEIAQEQLRRARAEEAEAYSRYRWMMDPEYFEQMARDRANQAKDGEFVVRRPTADDLKPREQKKKNLRRRRKD